MLDDVLTTLALKPEETRLYMQLLEAGAQSAGQLAKATGITRPSVYDYLKTLQNLGLVRQSLRFGVKRFQVSPPEQIGRLLDERMTALEKQKTDFAALLPLLSARGQQSFTAPHFQLFEGVAGMRQMLNDMLMYRNLQTRSFWPIQTTVETLSPEFFRRHNKARIENNLSVKAIWPLRRTVNIRDMPFLGAGKAFLREIRIAPDMVDMAMGYWIYGHKTMFLSSKNEAIGFIVESVEFAEMMTIQHDVLWKLSKRLPVDPHDVAPFLREIGLDV